jgi:hypothetical protein
MNTNQLLASIRDQLDTIEFDNQEDLTKSKVCEDSAYLMHVILVPFGEKAGMVVCIHSDPVMWDYGNEDSADGSTEIFKTYAAALDHYERIEL